MIEAGEVGAVFTIIDRASPVLKAIATQLGELDAALTRSKERMTALASTQFGGLVTRIGEINAQMNRTGNIAARTANEMVAGFGRATAGLEEASLKLSTSLTSTFAKVDESMAGMVTAMRSAKAEIAGISSELRAIERLPGPSIGGIGGGSGGSSGGGGGSSGGGGRRNIRGGHGADGVHFGRMSTELPGGSHVSLPGGPMMAAAAAAGYGIYLESEFEDQAARMFLTGQIEGAGPMNKDARFKQVRDTLQRISTQTGYSPKIVGDAMLGVERQFGGLPFDKRVEIEEALAPYAASEARLKETDFAHSFEALVGLAHMTGTYDPAKLPDLAKSFSYASLITPSSIGQFQNALSYSMPMLHAGLDMDPNSIMFLTAMMQTAGVKSTKSGTWLRSFFENAEPAIGTGPAAQHHNDALKRMGLLGEDNKPNWRVDGPDGKVDWNKSILALSDAIAKFTKSTPVDERLGIIKQAFGERGGGFASLMNLEEFLKQFPLLQEKMKNFQGGQESLEYLSKNSPIQQFRQTWADLQNVLMDAGKIALPEVSNALKEFDAGMKHTAENFRTIAAAVQPFVDALSKIPTPANAAAAALSGLGAALAGIPSMISGAISGISGAAGKAKDAIMHPGSEPGPSVIPGQPSGLHMAPKQMGSLVPPPNHANSGPRVADVWMDHQKVGKIMERGIAMNNRAVNSAAGHDGRDSWAPPDVSFA